MVPRLLVKDVISLDETRAWDDRVMGHTVFDPRIIMLENERSHEPLFWTPYWITVEGRAKYGQFAPIVKEMELSELLTKAIEKGWFSEGFRNNLRRALGS